MRRRLYLTLGVVAVAGLAGQFLVRAAHPDAHARNAFTPDAMQWGGAPPFIAPGAQLTVLEGDATANSGDFTVRLKMPAGYRIAPHWHPHRENVTVVSGTFKVGMGDTFDAQAAKPMTAGTYGYWEAGMKHFVWIKGETIVQFHGTGPWSIQYVNPADDPRNQAK